ncbi:glycosyl transferase family 2 [Pseudonocardia sediminis]|uniref:Glycosyl transferase family 2 n=1 Tax=Pseudonocardia sediminis TaxID=1397368 RepID=A0A4Q7V2Z5_PSEST|nr:glycosyl transferase family 2 [Pseudonocardia sediminis]
MNGSTLAVVIPAYNAERTIRRAIESARAVHADEIIVIDDGSDDGTAALAEHLQARVVVQINSGPGSARSAGERLAKSDYIVFLDADDALVKEGVIKSKKRLDADKGIAASVGRYYVQADSSGRTAIAARGYLSLDTTALVRLGHGPTPPSAIVYRRSSLLVANDISPCPLSPRYSEDYETLIRASMVGSVVDFPEPTCIYSVGAGRSSLFGSSELDDRDKVQRYYALAVGIQIKPWGWCRRSSTLLLKRARHARLRGNLTEFVFYSVCALIVDPRSGLRAIRRRVNTASGGRG